MVIVQEGSANADKFFLCTTDSSASLGSDSITFTVVQPSNVGDVTLTGTQTLTNKTLTSPVISDIVSVSNGDINLTPNGTGHVTVKGNTNPGSIQFNCESNSHGQILKAQAHSVGTSATIVLPAAAGTLVGTGDTGTLPLVAIDIDGGTDIGADLTTSDLIVVDDGAGGTNRKAALSRMITLVKANTDDPTALAIALG